MFDAIGISLRIKITFNQWKLHSKYLTNAFQVFQFDKNISRKCDILHEIQNYTTINQNYTTYTTIYIALNNKTINEIVQAVIKIWTRKQFNTCMIDIGRGGGGAVMDNIEKRAVKL